MKYTLERIKPDTGNLRILKLDDLKSEIFTKYGRQAILTDFVRLSNFVGSNYRDNIEDLFHACSAWIAEIIESDETTTVSIMQDNGEIKKKKFDRYDSCPIRPAISYSKIKDKCYDERINEYGVTEVKYGFYPQFATPVDELKELYEIYNSKDKSKYYIDYARHLLVVTSGTYKGHMYYVHETGGITYDDFTNRKEILDRTVGKELSNGITMQQSSVYFISLAPVTWLVDKENDLAISKYILDAYEKESGQIDYKLSEISSMLNVGNDKYDELVALYKEYDKKRAYMLKTCDERKSIVDFEYNGISALEQTKIFLENDVPTLYHGILNDDKLEQIKKLDPNLEVVDMTTVTVNGLIGKEFYNFDKNVTVRKNPIWYENLKEKCDKEPTKLHIVVFDDINNADKSVQLPALGIIFDKKIDGELELPNNARALATANNFVATTITAPLFSRFAHVYMHVYDNFDVTKTELANNLIYGINTNNIGELEYKLVKEHKNIHPVIQAYLSANYQDIITDYNGNIPNADYKKWKLASELLYNTNKVDIIRPILGCEVTQRFASQVSKKVISPEELIANEFFKKDFDESVIVPYLTAVSLSSIDEEHYDKAKKFINEMNPDAIRLFDSLYHEKEKIKRLGN